MDDARLDTLLARARDDFDAGIAASGSLARVRTVVMAQAAAPAASLPWRRIAAATLIAAIVGGAVDFAIPPARDATEIALNDPLFVSDIMDAQ